MGSKGRAALISLCGRHRGQSYFGRGNPARIYFRRDSTVAGSSAVVVVSLDPGRNPANQADAASAMVLLRDRPPPSYSVDPFAAVALDGFAGQAACGKNIRYFGSHPPMDAD